MLIKTRKNEKGEQLYQRIHIDREGRRTFFEEDVLSKINFQPSYKEQKRQKVVNSRRATAGRILQYVEGKRIQHETPYRLISKQLIVEKMYNLNKNK